MPTVVWLGLLLLPNVAWLGLLLRLPGVWLGLLLLPTVAWLGLLLLPTVFCRSADGRLLASATRLPRRGLLRLPVALLGLLPTVPLPGLLAASLLLPTVALLWLLASASC